MELTNLARTLLRPLAALIPAQPAASAAHAAALLFEFASLPPEAALGKLNSSVEGLLSRDAVERLASYGPNTVAHEAHKSRLRRLGELFATPLSMLLLVLATVSYLTGEIKGAVVIAIMVVLATFLSFVQEHRSSKAAERLRAMVSTTATVLRMDRRKGVPDDVNRYFEVHLRLRGPTREEMPIERLVPGDVVLLSAGDMLPADVRLLAAKDLFVNESALTVRGHAG